ncbi:MAG: FAD-dependent oxidoreductase [Microthrixaceae bacterium]
MERRRFLQATGVGALTTAAAWGTVGCTPSPQPGGPPQLLDLLWPPDERRRIVTVAPRNPTAPPTLARPGSRSALVVGAGLAGLSAALELAERGYRVTVREASDVIGGRLATRDLDPGLGRTFRVEHGLHMWFDNYRTFRDVRHRLGIDHHFRPYNTVNFQFRNYQPERLESSPKVFPLNLLGIVDRSPNLDWDDVVGSLGILPDLLQFDLAGLYDRLDGISFLEWIERTKVAPAFRDVIMLPAATVTLNRVADLSAAEMLLYQHLYFLSQPYAFDREVTTTDHGTAIIDPWVARLRSLGVDVQTGAPVPGLRVIGNRVVGVLGERRRHDWVVLACDVRGTQAVLDGSTADASGTAALQRVRSRVAPMEVAPPYRILRVWFDRPLDPSRTDVIETPEFHPIVLMAQFHLLEDESRRWAATTGGSVIEFHLYALEDDLATLPDEAVWDRIRPTALEVVPELADAEVLGSTVGTYGDFTSFATGQGRVRPFPQTPATDGLANLLLAGDWVQSAVPSALMERAVLTGRLAANECLIADGVREAAYSHVSPLGPAR